MKTVLREIVFDTETTGLSPENGDRLVEIGAVELINHIPTGRTYHQYINPERSVPEEVVAVHAMLPGIRPSARWWRINIRLLFRPVAKSRLAYIAPPMGWVSSQIFS